MNQYKWINDPETLNDFKRLFWDYKLSDDEIKLILSGKEYRGITKQMLFDKILKGFRWRVIRTLFNDTDLKEMLQEDNIKTLWPKSIQENYRYARQRLFE